MQSEEVSEIVFSVSDPFPWVSDCSYAGEQIHAEAVDRWLGLRTAEIERSLAQSSIRSHEAEHWIGLPVQAMLTPYTEIRKLLQILSPVSGSTLVDLGAGYGRMGFVIGRHFPEVSFIGYECVRERVGEAVRCLTPWRYSNVQIVEADLSSPTFRPKQAEYYFIYDYGSREAVEKTLEDLKAVAACRPIVVVGRGRRSRDAIERGHPWLSQVNPPEHHGRFSIYRS